MKSFWGGLGRVILVWPHWQIAFGVLRFGRVDMVEGLLDVGEWKSLSG